MGVEKGTHQAKQNALHLGGAKLSRGADISKQISKKTSIVFVGSAAKHTFPRQARAFLFWIAPTDRRFRPCSSAALENYLPLAILLTPKVFICTS
jgi:hypothetical protein